MFCVYTRPRYQVSVYSTIGPLVVVIIIIIIIIIPPHSRVIIWVLTRFPIGSYRPKYIESSRYFIGR